MSPAYLSITHAHNSLIYMEDLITTVLIPWIDAKRQAAGLSQAQLAAALGCTQSRVSQLLGGDTTISLKQYDTLSRVIDFCPAEGLQLLHPERRGRCGRAC